MTGGLYEPQGHDQQDLYRGPLYIATHKIGKLWAFWFWRIRFFLCFSGCKSMGANDLRGGAIFHPRGMVGRIYKEDNYTLLHTKYESSGPYGFGEEDFSCFPMTPPGRGVYGPQAHGWQDK